MNPRDTKICVICKKPFTGYGHNPAPVARLADGHACDTCNVTVVIPARVRLMTTKC